MMMLDDTVHGHARWTGETARYRTGFELAVLAVILPEALMLLFPRQADHVVPLMTLVPILFGLRYGYTAGVTAAILLGLVFFQLAHFAPQPLAQFPQAQVAASLIASFIAGQFHDHWTRRLRDTCEVAALDRRRLAQFTSTFHVLKASHANLERQLVSNRTSLRSALQCLALRLAKPDAQPCRPLEDVGASLLEVLAESAHLHAGSVYAINEHGMLAPAPVASFGAAAPLSPFNPLLRQALDSASAVSIRANDTSIDRIIAVVPLADSCGFIHGVVSINQLPFVAIEQHTFDLMSIVARHVADLLSGHLALFGSMADCRALQARFRQGATIALAQKMALALVVLRIADPAQGKDQLARCLQAQRGIDQPWVCQDRCGQSVVALFLPIPDEAVALAVAQRMHAQLQVPPTAGGNNVHSVVRMLDAHTSPDEALALALEVCDLGDSTRGMHAQFLYPERVS